MSDKIRCQCDENRLDLFMKKRGESERLTPRRRETKKEQREDAGKEEG